MAKEPTARHQASGNSAPATTRPLRPPLSTVKGARDPPRVRDRCRTAHTARSRQRGSCDRPPVRLDYFRGLDYFRAHRTEPYGYTNRHAGRRAITRWLEQLRAGDQAAAQPLWEGYVSGPLTQLLQSEPVPVRQRRPDLGEELAGIIHQALAQKPEARFADVRAFRQARHPFAT
jgi:hypothetical protein